MEELHFVYINANGRIGVHSIQSISYSENHIYRQQLYRTVIC